ncbi:MAG: hypothetical protein AAF267_24450 [Deinococcota bacterium]
MTVPLLATKLYQPVAPAGSVARPRLLEQVQAGLTAASACKLTLITAPAGSGKTTLVSQCLHDQVASVAWVSLDASDNDLTRFLLYVLRALQTVQEDLGESAMTMLKADQVSSPEVIITALINDLATLTTQLVFVFTAHCPTGTSHLPSPV